MTTTAAFTVDAGGAVALNGATSVGGALDVQANANNAAGGAISGSGAISVTGTTTLETGTPATATNDVTLSNAANDFTGAVTVTSANDVTMVDANSLSIGSITASNTVNLTASAGSISDATDDAVADISAGGLITLDATAGIDGAGADGRLDLASGSSVNASATSGSSIALRGVGTLVLTDVDTDGAGNIDVIAPGQITATDVNATGTGDITLETTSGDILVGFVNADGDMVTITSAGAIEESGDDPDVDIDGRDVLLTAVTGIGAAGTIEIDAFAGVGDGLTATVTGSGAINVADDGNLRVISATTADGAISISAAGNLTVDTEVTAGGNSRNVTLTTTGSGNVTLTGTTTADGDQVQINSAANINGAGLVTGSTIDLNADTGIGNSTPLMLVGSTITADSATSGDVVLNNALATAVSVTSLTTASGSVEFNQSGGGDLTTGTVTSTNAATLSNIGAGFIALDGSVTTNVLVVVANGAVTDGTDGDLAIAGQATIAGSTITLGDDAGNSTDFGSLRFGSSGAVSISEDSSTNLFISSNADSLILISAGAITDDSDNDLTITGNASFTGTSITLGEDVDNDVDFGSLTFNSAAGAVNITEDSDTELTGTNTADSLILVSAGAVTDASGTSITIDNGNASFNGTSISLGDNADTLSVSGTAIFDGGAGSITVAAAGTVNFGSLTFNTTGGAVDITEDSSTTVSGASTAGAGLTLTSADDINLNDTIDVTGNTIITAGTVANGAIDVNAKLTGSGSILLDAADGITVDAEIDPTTVTLEADDDIVINAPVTATTLITVSAGLDGTGSVTVDGSGAETGSLTTTDAGSDIAITSGATTGAITLDGNVTAMDRVTLTSNGTGDITQPSGTLSAANLQVTAVGNATLNSATNDVDTLAVDLNPGEFQFTDADDVTVGTVATSGIATGNGGAGGAVTINATSGTITVDQAITTAMGTGGGISISGSVVINASVTAAGGTVTLNGQNTGAFDLDINASLVSSAGMSLTAPRDILVGALVQTTGAGSDLTLTADSDADGDGGVQVEAAGQVDSARDVTILGSDLAADAVGVESVQIDDDGAGVNQVLAARNITIQSGANAPADADIEINGQVSSTGTAVNITIDANEDALFGANGDVLATSATSGTLHVFAIPRGAGPSNGGAITMADGTVFNAGAAEVEIVADDTLQIGEIITIGVANIASLTANITDADAGAGNDITAASLAISGETGVGDDADAIETTLSTLSGRANSGDFNISNTGNLDLNAVSLTTNVQALFTALLGAGAPGTQVIGVSIEDMGAGGGTANSGNDNITIVTAGSLTVSLGPDADAGAQQDTGGVQNNDGGNITLTATGATASDDLTINAPVDTNGGTGTITFNAGDSIIQSDDGDVSASGAGAIDYNAGTGTATGVITMADGATTTSGSGLVTMDADGNVTIGGITTAGEVRINTTGGAIIDGGDTDADITAATAELIAFTGIGDAGDTNGALDTVADGTAGSLTIAAVTESGDINITNTGHLIVGMVNGTTGATITDGADNNLGDNINLIANSPLTVDEAVVNNDGGNITLTATNDGGNDDDLTISANVTAAGGNGFIDLNAGHDLFIDSGAVVSTVGMGAIDGDAPRSILISGASTVQTDSGSITFNGNAAGTTSGNFVGIEVDGSTISTSTGVVTMTGVGGDTGSGNHGIRIDNGATIESTGTTAGGLTLDGTGKATGGRGVLITDSTTKIVTVDGDLLITGDGAIGVQVSQIDRIESTGVGGDAASVTIIGTASGLTTAVLLDGTSTRLRTDDGDISITGTVAGVASSTGVTIDRVAEIRSVGVGASAGTITIVGTSGGGVPNSRGVSITSLMADATVVASVDGDISITGTANATGNGNGVLIGDFGTKVDATGTADILIQGNGGAGSSVGVVVRSRIASNSGTVTVTAFDDIQFVSAGIDSVSGLVTVTADTSPGNNGGFIQMFDGTFINAGSGQIDLDADGNIRIANLRTTSVVGPSIEIDSSSGGVIDSGDADLDIVTGPGGSVVIRSVTGIGSGNALETDLNASTLAAINTTSGSIQIDDVGANAGLLTIGTVDGLTGVTNQTPSAGTPATTGFISISNASPITVADDIIANGNITLTTGDTAAGTDDLIVNALDTAGTDDVDIQSNDGSITLNVGDDATINGDLTASAFGQIITINLDALATDADIDTVNGGGTLIINGTTSVITTNAGTFINGGSDNDTFDFPPQNTTSFTVNGNPPVFADGAPGVPPGDTLNLDFANVVEPPTLTTGVPGAGIYSFTPTDGERFVDFSSIETVTIANNNVNYHLVIDPTLAGSYGDDGTDDHIEVRLNGPADGGTVGTELIIERTAVGGAGPGEFVGNIFRGTVADILSLTIQGTSDNETLTINETNGLPDFNNAGGFNAVSPVALGGVANTLREVWFDGSFGDTQLNLDSANANSFLATNRGTTNLLTSPIDYTGATANTASGGLTGPSVLGGLWVGRITIGQVGFGAPLEAGDITFGTSSDDGSTLWIDLNQNGQFDAGNGELIVDNSGSHGVQDRVGTVNLAAGTYNIGIAWYDVGGASSMEARYAQGTVAEAAYGTMTVINPGDVAQAGLFNSETLGNIHLRNAADNNDQAEFVFIGRGGTDAVNYTFGSAATSNVTYAIGDGQGGGDNQAGGNSEGAILTTDNAGGSMLFYFTGLEPLAISGSAGGRFTLLGDNEDNLINIEDSPLVGHTRFTASSVVTTQNNGVGTYESVDVAANSFANIDVFGMLGADYIDLIAMDAAQNTSLIELNGDDTLDGDTSDDTIRVRSYPAGNMSSLFGGAGNDTFLIFDDANTVDFILGRMMIDGEGGTDTVIVDDSGSNPAGEDGETVTVNILAGVPNLPGIEGIFGAGAGVTAMGTDIIIANRTATAPGSVEILTVSTSADNDDINVDMNGVTVTDLTTITINGSNGSDLFNIQSNTPSDATTNLNGNAGADQFFFAPGQFVLTGAIDGGTGNDALDYSSYGAGRTIQLTAVGSVDGFQGNDASGAPSITPVVGDSFDNIDILIGSGQDDTLIGPNLRNHWDIGGDIEGFDDAHFNPTGGARTDGGLQLVNSLTDAGVLVADEADLSLAGNASSIGRPTGANPIAPNAAGEQDLAFTDFQFFVGALTQDDRFDLRDGASITGTVDGRGGNDTVDYRDWTTPVNVDLNTGTATSVFGGAAAGLIAGTGGGTDDNSIENAFGGDGNDMIFGDDDDNILGDGFGNDLLIGDRAREGVDPTGITSGDDTFRLEPTAGVVSDVDVVYDIAGNDTIDFRFSTNAVVYDADIIGIQDVFNAGTNANVDLRLHDMLITGAPDFIPQPATGNTPFENVVGSQFNDIIDIDPLSISGNFPTEIPVNRFVDGNSPVVGGPVIPLNPIPPGDILRFDAKGQVVQDTGLSLTAQGVGTVAYRSIETITSFDDAPRFIDNGDDFVTTFPNTTTTANNGAKWIEIPDAGFGGDFLYSLGPGVLGTATPNTVTWTSNGVATGLYRVSMTWPDLGPEYLVSSAVPVQVFDGDTLLATIPVNQLLAPSDLLDGGVFWKDLGIFNFQSHTARIVLSNETDGSVFADAIRLEQISPNPELRVELQDSGEYISDGVDIVDVTSVIGQPQTRTFIVKNEGTTNLSITDIELEQGTGTNWQLTTPQGTAFTLAPGQSSFITVTLLATTANGQADFPAELRIFSNDVDENVAQLPGQGVNPNPDPDPLNDVNPFTIQLNGVVTTVDIIDDGDSRFKVFGVWSESGGIQSVPNAFGTGVVSTPNDGSGDRAVWTFSNLPDGRYRVSTSWPNEARLNLTTVEYRVLNSTSVLATVQIDQSVAPNDLNANGVTFEDLGGPFDIVGGTIIVELRDTKLGSIDTNVVADAVRIERLFDMVPEATLFDGGVGGTEIADDTGVVSFGTVLPGSQVQKTFTVRNDGTQPLTVREPINLPAAYTLISFNGLPPTNATEVTLNPGQTVEFVVQLNASTVGVISGEMSFATGELVGGANADPDENPINVTLTANIQSTVIVDNQDATGFAATSGFELFGGYQGFNTRVHFDSAAGTGDTATWTFQVDPGSTYRIGTTYTSIETRATNAPYTVSGIVGGNQVVLINQRQLPDDRIANGSAFEDLGVFVADGTGIITVTLSDAGNGTVVADAVRLEALFGPEIEVMDNTSGLNLQNSTSSVDFGDTTQGGAALTRTFTITNDGQRELALGPINLPRNYQLVGAFPISIAANGGTGTFTVQLISADAGTYGGVLSFANDDADEGFFNFTITGTVIGATPTIIDNIDPGFSSVGSFSVFTGSGRDGSFEASNAGTGAGVATWSFTGLAPGVYNVATTWTEFFNRSDAAPYTVIDATGSTSFLINQLQAPDDFTETFGGLTSTWESLPGSFIVDGSGTLTVTLSDLAVGYVDADAVRVEMIGNQPEIVVTDLGANQAVGGGDDVNVSDGGTFSFGATTPGVPVVQTFNIGNPGTAPLIVGQLTLPTGFTTTYAPQTIAAGGNATFTITYDGIVDATGTFQFLTNDDDENPFNFTVTGTATPGVTIIDDGDGGFGSSAGFSTVTTQSNEGFQGDVRIAAGDSSGDTATWTFNGLTPGGTYRVSSTWFPFATRATDAPFTISGIDGGPLTIDVNQQITPASFRENGEDWLNLETVRVDAGGTITVTLSDTANGQVVADAVRVEQVVGNNPEIIVHELGQVIADGSTFNFGTAGQNSTLSRTFTVLNSGQTDLTVQTPVLPNGFTTSFTTTTIAAGTSANIVVNVTTTTEGVFSGSLSFASNDANESPFNLNVSATVAAPTPTIIDNGDLGFTATGGFSAFGGQGFMGDVHFASGDASGDTATYSFTGLADGQYLVSTSWTPFSNRATDAPYSINGGAAIDINQQVAPDDFTADGVAWERLGIVTVTGGAGTITVVLSDDANQIVIADAVRIDPIFGAEITVLDGTTVINQGGTLNFGNVVQGTPSVTRTITVRNDGPDDLILQPITPPAGFTITSGNFTPNQIVVSGASVTFDVEIDTSTAGVVSGVIEFNNNDADESPFNFTVTGTITSNVVQIIDNGDLGYITSVEFTRFNNQGFQGDVDEDSSPGTGTSTSTWTFNNLVAGGIYRVSATWSAFSNRATDAPYTVSGLNGPDVTVDLNQREAPNDFTDQGAAFEDIGTFTLAPAGTTLTVTLSDDANGNVIADAIRIERVTMQVEDVTGAVEIADDSGSVDFGSVLVGGTFSKVFRVNNVGTAPLTVQPVSVPAGFTVVSDFAVNQVIPAGMSATFEVGVDSTTPGTFTGQIQFANDSFRNPFNFTATVLVGTPVPKIIDDGDATFSSTGGFMAFGGQGFQNDVRFAAGDNSGDTATWTFVNLQPGTYRVSATWSEFSNRATDAPYSINGGPAIDINQELAPNDPSFTSVLDVASGKYFADLSGGFVHAGGDLTVTLSDDANEFVIADAIRIERLVAAEVEVLAGMAGAPVLVDGVSTFNFGNAQVGETKSQVFTVNNVGVTDLTVQPVSIPAGFTFISNLGTNQVITAGGSATFEIGVNSAAPGSFSGTLQFANDDSDENPFNITIVATVGPDAPVVIDNGDAGFSTTSGFVTWNGQGFQNDVAEDNNPGNGGVATWTFPGLSSGTYRISTTWSAFSNRATDAPYSINGGAAILINQQLPPSDGSFTSVLESGVSFADLDGAFAFAGGTLTVTLSDSANGNIIADAIRVERLSPLQAVGGQAAEDGDASELTLEQVQLIGLQAVQIWTATGLTDDQANLLATVTFDVRDLIDGHLGAASANAIFLDINGAGYGWFVDSTPLINEEFQLIDGQLAAIPGGSSDGQMDLLTVVLHELGHVLGLDDLSSTSAAGSLMSENIAAGIRRLPNGIPAGGGLSTTPSSFAPASSSGDSSPDGLLGLLETPLVGNQTPAELYADRHVDEVSESNVQPMITRPSDDEADGIDTVFSFLTDGDGVSTQIPFDVL